jgi:hypothetical protein
VVTIALAATKNNTHLDGHAVDSGGARKARRPELLLLLRALLHGAQDRRGALAEGHLFGAGLSNTHTQRLGAVCEMERDSIAVQRKRERERATAASKARSRLEESELGFELRTM